MPEIQLVPSQTIISTQGNDFSIKIYYPDLCLGVDCDGVEVSNNLPDTLLGEITSNNGTQNQIGFEQGDLLITMKDHPADIDYNINNQGELIVVSQENDAHKYSIDSMGYLIYDCCAGIEELIDYGLNFNKSLDEEYVEIPDSIYGLIDFSQNFKLDFSFKPRRNYSIFSAQLNQAEFYNFLIGTIISDRHNTSCSIIDQNGWILAFCDLFQLATSLGVSLSYQTGFILVTRNVAQSYLTYYAFPYIFNNVDQFENFSLIKNGQYATQIELQTNNQTIPAINLAQYTPSLPLTSIADFPTQVGNKIRFGVESLCEEVTQDYLHGSLKDIKLFNALNNLVLDIPFNETNGQIAQDYSGNNLDGVLNHNISRTALGGGAWINQ